MKVIVTGDRNWNDLDTLMQVLSIFPKNTILVHGNCRGADKMAGKIGVDLGFDVVPYPADWYKYGFKAGPIRNKQMLFENMDADVVLAFHNDLVNSKGTRHMVDISREAGKKVWVFNGKP